MDRTKKVITTAKFKASDSSALLNTNIANRAVAIGCRIDESEKVTGYIGKVAEHSGGKNILDFGVWADLSFPHVVGIFGTRGTGKSYDLGVYVECMANLEGTISGKNESSSIVVFDVQNQFWTLGLRPNQDLQEDKLHIDTLTQWGLKASMVEGIKLWLPAGCKSNLPGTSSFRLSPNQLEDSDWLALLDLERYSPTGQALLALLADNRDLTPSGLAARAHPGHSLSSFQQSTIDALKWRLQALAISDLVGEPGIDATDLLCKDRVSIILLRDLPESLRALTVGVLTRIFAKKMGAYHQAKRVSRRYGSEIPKGELPERLCIVLDEAHVVAPREGKTAATLPIVDYVKRGRDSGLSFIFATQQPSAVENKLMSQVDLTITHSLGFESDLQAATARMPTRTSVNYERSGFRLPSLMDVIRTLEPGEAIVADSANGRIFIVKIRPRVTAHGGTTPTS